ncbi:MAG: hypothetical protein M3135_05850, partial [Actinomycetota bacterium]|nr:hypothetical protein [Actinomycetota bacterium]
FQGRQEVDFHAPVGSTEVYFTGVPDPVAVARFIPGVRDATAKGAFYQPEANRLIEDMIRSGQTPAEGERYPEIARRDVPLAVRVEVDGSRSGATATLGYEVHDHSRRATTAFTALAAMAVARGELDPGVAAPEAWPTPAPFLAHLLEDPHVRILHWRDGGPPRPLEITDR